MSLNSGGLDEYIFLNFNDVLCQCIFNLQSVLIPLAHFNNKFDFDKTINRSCLACHVLVYLLTTSLNYLCLPLPTESMFSDYNDDSALKSCVEGHSLAFHGSHFSFIRVWCIIEHCVHSFV